MPQLVVHGVMKFVRGLMLCWGKSFDELLRTQSAVLNLPLHRHDFDDESPNQLIFNILYF